MVRIREPSASLRASTNGRYRHQTGNANVIVTRRMAKTAPTRKDQAPLKSKLNDEKSKLNDKLKRLTETSKEPSHRPIRLKVSVEVLTPEVITLLRHRDEFSLLNLVSSLAWPGTPAGHRKRRPAPRVLHRFRDKVHGGNARQVFTSAFRKRGSRSRL